MKYYLLFLFAFVSGLGSVSAEDSSAVEADLIAEYSAIQPGKPFDVSVRFQIEDHWHTYWKNGGDSGLATAIEWDLPEGWTAGPIRWAPPQRIVTDPLVSFGYEGEVHHLVTLTPPDSLPEGAPVTLQAQVNWLECKEICLPGEATLSLTLPVQDGPPPPSPQHDAVARARNQLPASPEAWTVEVRADREGPTLHLTPPGDSSQANLEGAFFFPAEGGWMENAAPQPLRQDPDAGTWFLRLPVAVNGTVPESIQGVLSSPSGFPPDGDSLEIDAVIREGAGGGTTSQPMARGAYIGILGFGFLGGIILNLMPCVFPVLGIKVMNLVSQSGESRAKVRGHGLAFTAGVLVSFWILAGLLLALRSAGNELGWGFQLQEPGFVYLLTVFLFLFGLNMSGVFEVGGSAVGLSGSTSQDSLSGSFLSGTLATIVATPCAAPFLATALGAALTLPALPSLGLFTLIGLGLSLPFLALTLFPQLTGLLPRPGQWMLILKQALAFLLYGSAGYLLWVLVGQVGETHFLWVLLSMVGAGLAAWLYGGWQGPEKSTRTRRLTAIAALILLILSLQWGWPRPGLQWETWSPEKVAAYREADRPIYIDFTARWCATCQTNKLAVFSSDRVLETIQKKNVALLKADWTNRDPQITRELKRWDRAAIPFNLIYLPKEEDPIILPEILTPGIVLNALQSGEN